MQQQVVDENTCSTNRTNHSAHDSLLNSARMEAIVGEIRRSSSWIKRVANRKKTEQNTISLPASHACYNDLGDACSSNTASPLQDIPPICLVHQCLEEDSIDEEHSAMKQQKKYQIHSGSMDTLSVRSFTQSSAPFSQYGSGEHMQFSELEIVEGAHEHRVNQHGQCAKLCNMRRLLHILAQTSLLLFMVALCVDVKSKADSPVALHPLLMGAMLILSTEAVIILQFASWPIAAIKKKKLRTLHAILQCSSVVFGIAGIAECISKRNEISTESNATSSSSHRCLGKLAAFILLVQMIFGLYTRFATKVFGRGPPPSYLHKYHRVLGYISLFFLWASAWLGIHNPQWTTSTNKQNDIPSGYMAVNSWIWFSIFAGLIIGILAPINMEKLGFK
ncbi:eukaryotic cytochrome b561-domain-containing protein [Coemansia spiralis]|nr:eukaryotic cytochrome b561-domain-containing protein [Coemansia spiralis]